MKALVPIDGSQNSKRTINALVAMKEKFSTSLTLLHVFDHERISYRATQDLTYEMVIERGRQAARQFLEDQKIFFAAQGMQVEVIFKEGPARKTICDLADSGEFDLLIIGRHTEGELRSLLFGQVSNYVIHKVKIPMMVI
jgi:nucleotide-binding universal stress UspA family protein